MSNVLVSTKKMQKLVDDYILAATQSFIKLREKEREKAIKEMRRPSFWIFPSKWRNVPDEDITDDDIIAYQSIEGIPLASELDWITFQFKWRIMEMDKFRKAIKLSDDDLIELSLEDIETYGFHV